nr:hypothetical protein Iba_chr06cCG6790 [Ipomoea batatas]
MGKSCGYHLPTANNLCKAASSVRVRSWFPISLTPVNDQVPPLKTITGPSQFFDRNRANPFMDSKTRKAHQNIEEQRFYKSQIIQRNAETGEGQRLYLSPGHATKRNAKPHLIGRDPTRNYSLHVVFPCKSKSTHPNIYTKNPRDATKGFSACACGKIAENTSADMALFDSLPIGDRSCCVGFSGLVLGGVFVCGGRSGLVIGKSVGSARMILRVLAIWRTKQVGKPLWNYVSQDLITPASSATNDNGGRYLFG